MDFMDILISGIRGMVGPEAAAYALAAIGLNMHFGYTGLLNFGQVGFMLVGAYGVAVPVATWHQSLWLGLIIGLMCAVVLALILGIPTLRLRGDYLAIATIAAGEVLRYFYRSSYAEPLTGGVYGLREFADPFFDLNPYPSTGGLSIGALFFDYRSLWVMTVGWGVAVIASILIFQLIRSPWGRVLKSVREDETAARSLGKNAYGFKLQSLVIGGALGALGGMLLAIDKQAVAPSYFDPRVTFYLFAIMILGGASRILGPIVGSVVFWFVLSILDEMMRENIASGGFLSILLKASDVGAVRIAFVGLVIVVLMLFRPAGILGNRKELRLDAQ